MQHVSFVRFASFATVFVAVKAHLYSSKKLIDMSIDSVVVLKESPCPRGPIYKSVLVNLSLSSNLKSLSLLSDHKSFSFDHKVFENCQGLSILQIVCYVRSREVHYHHHA